MKMNKRKINSLYIHIPFCNSICPYCDFTKFLKKTNFEDQYINELIEDIKKTQISFFKFNTIYIGGGTPSCLSNENLEKILIECQKLAKKGTEFTIEANPEDLDDEKLNLFKKYGINRISIGIQSFNTDTLKMLGRKSIDFKSLIKKVKKYIKNINIDLIYGLPNENIEVLKENLKKFVSLNCSHISIYSLTVNPGTIFFNKHIKEIDEDQNRLLYDYICSYLKDHGYDNYEVSNFAKNGKYSKHNINYWKCGNYVGLGAGASGYIDNKRYTNTSNLNKYQEHKDRLSIEEELTKDQQIEEYLMLNLRTKWGLNLEEFNARFGLDLLEVAKDYIQLLINKKLAIINKGSLCLTHDGIAIMDSILLKIFNLINL